MNRRGKHPEMINYLKRGILMKMSCVLLTIAGLTGCVGNPDTKSKSSLIQPESEGSSASVDGSFSDTDTSEGANGTTSSKGDGTAISSRVDGSSPDTDTSGVDTTTSSKDGGTATSSKAISTGSDSSNTNQKIIYTIPYAKWIEEESMKNDWYHYDIIKLAVSLQGRLNAQKPTLFVDDDRAFHQGSSRSASFYFDYMRRGPGDVLYGYEVKSLDTIDDFLNQFKNEIVRAGLVVWDEQVAATSNAAFTACGIDGYYPVRYDSASNSLYTHLVKKFKAPVKLDLKDKFTGKGKIWGTNRASTGSKKNDVYIWAIEKYMSKCGYEYLGYLVDSFHMDKRQESLFRQYGAAFTMLPNADFLIMKKAFFFDLIVHKDEKAPDDPGQAAGTDYKTLTEILKKTYSKHGGTAFTQTNFGGGTKYQNDTIKKYNPDFQWNNPLLNGVNWLHEQDAGKVFTSYNCVIDGDCGSYFSMFNCSIYSKHKLKDVYKNTNKPKKLSTYDPQKIYIMYHMGDYDGAAWMTHRSLDLYYKDSSRGKLPLAWAFNPNLSKRIPVVFDYIRENAGKNDFFIGGDSGAGYAYPSQLTAEGRAPYSGLPDGTQAWINWNKPFYKQFDLSITGFVHNGVAPLTPALLKPYLQFSPDGASGWLNPVSDRFLVDGTMPYIGTYLAPPPGDPKTGYFNIQEGVDIVLNTIDNDPNLHFYFFRTVIASPSALLDMTEALKAKRPEIELVDPYTFFGFLKQHLS